MKRIISKSMLVRFIKILKWGKIVAKFTAVGTMVSGAVTALSGSATTGVVLSATGATSYAVAKGLPQQGYEKTKHIPPGRVDKTANLLRQQKLVAQMGHKNAENSASQARGSMPGIVIPIKQPSGRMGAGTSSLLTMRKTNR